MILVVEIEAPVYDPDGNGPKDKGHWNEPRTYIYDTETQKVIAVTADGKPRLCSKSELPAVGDALKLGLGLLRKREVPELKPSIVDIGAIQKFLADVKAGKVPKDLRIPPFMGTVRLILESVK